MTTIILILAIIIAISMTSIVVFVLKTKDERLRKWCIKQASNTNIRPYFDENTGFAYATETDFVSLAEKYYLFMTEHITYLSDEDKEIIFPEKYHKKEDDDG